MASTSDNTTSKKSLRRKAIEEGILAAHYTLNGWFVKIKPVFDETGQNEFMRDKPSVLFSFVEKGKAKDNHFDVYMDIDMFDVWADDILSERRIFLAELEAEKKAGEKFPKRYKFVTGQNGEKSVGFAPSTTKGACATINGTCGKKYANVPISYDQLRITAKWFKRVSTEWFRVAALETLSNSKSSNFRTDTGDDYQGDCFPSEESPDAQPHANATPNTNTNTNTSAEGTDVFKVKVQGSFESDDKKITAHGALESGEKVNVVFSNGVINTMGNELFEKLKVKAQSPDGATFMFEGMMSQKEGLRIVYFKNFL